MDKKQREIVRRKVANYLYLMILRKDRVWEKEQDFLDIICLKRKRTRRIIEPERIVTEVEIIKNFCNKTFKKLCSHTCHTFPGEKEYKYIKKRR